MDDNFFTEKELRNANRGSVAPVVVVILVIIALLGLAFFGGKYYLASRNNIKIFMNDYFDKLEDNIGKNNSTLLTFLPSTLTQVLVKYSSFKDSLIAVPILLIITL